MYLLVVAIPLSHRRLGGRVFEVDKDLKLVGFIDIYSVALWTLYMLPTRLEITLQLSIRML